VTQNAKIIPAASAATLCLPTARSTKISTKNIGETRPPPDDGVIEALPRPVGTITIIKAAADDKRSKSPTAGPSTAAGLSPGSVLKIVTTANASDDGVFKLAEPVAKHTILPDNLSQST
jgi:hypothetical protein